MFRKRFHGRVSALNTTSTADISFMLLVFFLVTTSIDSDYGLQRRLAPMPEDGMQEELVVKRSDMMVLAIDAAGTLTCDGKEVAAEKLPQRIETFVEGNRKGHVISVEVDRAATYDAYFTLQEAIVAAYGNLRDRYARRRFGKPFAGCTADERSEVVARYPQRISESMEGGAQ